MSELLLFPNTPPDALSLRDEQSRREALNVRGSYVVTAPAGSGKTDLLTRRFLKLLSLVEEPEQVLAMTFTNAATAEMRTRILDLLRANEAMAARVDDSDSPAPLAHAAMQHAQARGWNLLEQPQRLNIQSIDSLCLRLAHGQPLLARLGGSLQPTEHGAALYRGAARNVLRRLGGADASLSRSIAALLALRDNSLEDCEDLIAGMLARRDQWRRVLPLGLQQEEHWEQVRSALEQPFERAIRNALLDAHEILHEYESLLPQLFELANFACNNEPQTPITGLTGLQSLPAPEAKLLSQWHCLCSLLLTNGNTWRKSYNKNDGFPPDSGKQQKEQLLAIVAKLKPHPRLLGALCRLRSLPALHYTEEQWQTLRHTFSVLLHALAELRVLFAERNQVDFVEVALAALDLLEEGSERATRFTDDVRHLLIDEFQDTSRLQHQLVRALLRDWPLDSTRTCFVVGDPMQSIYLFRQADVELFLDTSRSGFALEGRNFPLASVSLSRNFRSHAGLVDKLNHLFHAIDDQPSSTGATQIRFTQAVAVEAAPTARSVHVHPFFVPAALNDPAQSLSAQRQREAEQVRDVVCHHLPRIAAAQAASQPYTVAVLVRVRAHLAPIVQLLRERQIPFRAVETEHLAKKQEIQDLLALTRALMHPMDRTAWLAMLRAPWCGLGLSALHTLCGSDDPLQQQLPMQQLIERNAALLPPEERARTEATAAILARAIESRSRQGSFSEWIERTWNTLGGPSILTEAEMLNAEAFFSMLDTLSIDGTGTGTTSGPASLDASGLDEQLAALFAQPDPAVSSTCGIQLMTIHKSKGLGFDVVIVPALDRRPCCQDKPLVSWMQRRIRGSAAADDDEEELLAAPIGSRGEDSQPTYAWVQQQRQQRESEERKRIFYVACTRARRELHLSAVAKLDHEGKLCAPEHGSLLECAWPALSPYFEEATANLQPVARSASVAFNIAASAEPAAYIPLRRLRQPAHLPVAELPQDAGASEEPERLRRPEARRAARLAGAAVHAALEHASQQLAAGRPLALTLMEEAARAILRKAALPEERIAREMVNISRALAAVARDSTALWLLGPRAEAQSEVSWTGWFEDQAGPTENELKTLRADRIFRAGPDVGSDAGDTWWIVDYKTAAPMSDPGEHLARQRKIYGPQLESYGRALRMVLGREVPLRLALYFPMLQRLDWWQG